MTLFKIKKLHFSNVFLLMFVLNYGFNEKEKLNSILSRYSIIKPDLTRQMIAPDSSWI